MLAGSEVRRNQPHRRLGRHLQPAAAGAAGSRPGPVQHLPFDTQGQHRPGTPAWFARPICRLVEGRLDLVFIPWYIRESQQYADAPRLTPDQDAVLRFIGTTANDPDHFLDMDFRPGDIQFLKNASILHKRTAYEDWDEPARKRHLLRRWLVQEGFSAGDASLREGIRTPD